MLELTLQRRASARGATIGWVKVGLKGFWTLEDEIREIPGRPVSEWKVYGQTAIPAGRYQVKVTESARFKRPLPLLLNVPGYEGVRIHPGNVPADTDGCILVGKNLNLDQCSIGESRIACDELFHLIDAELAEPDGQVWIDIRNPV